jgi:hypothetical protein
MRLSANVASPFALLIVAIVLAGCGPEWTVIKQATPNAMTPASRFVIERASFDPNFRVGEKTEQEWMREKRPETQESWDSDKVAMADCFVEGFMAEGETILVESGPGRGVFRVRARYTYYDPGFWAAIVSEPNVIEANVEFLDGSGDTVDVIRVRVKTPAGYSVGVSAGQRARTGAKEIGAITARYLKQRLGL